MAEQTLSQLVVNLMEWIECLHEKNLKYQAQVETLSRDKEVLEAQLSDYQKSTNNQHLHHHHHHNHNHNQQQQPQPQVTNIYQPTHQAFVAGTANFVPTQQTLIASPQTLVASPQTFVPAPQPSPYIWSGPIGPGHQQAPAGHYPATYNY